MATGKKNEAHEVPQVMTSAELVALAKQRADEEKKKRDEQKLDKLNNP